MKRPTNDLSPSNIESQFPPAKKPRIEQRTSDNGRVADTRHADCEYIYNPEKPILGRLWRYDRNLVSGILEYCDLETILALRLASKDLNALRGYLTSKAMTVFKFETEMNQDKFKFGSIHKIIAFRLSYLRIRKFIDFSLKLNIDKFHTILRGYGICALKKLQELSSNQADKDCCDRIKEARIELWVRPQKLLSLMQNPKSMLHSIAQEKLKLKLAISRSDELHKLPKLFLGANSKYIDRVIKLNLGHVTNDNNTNINEMLLQTLIFFTGLRQLAFGNVEGEGNMDIDLRAPESKVRSLRFRYINADICSTISLPELTKLHFDDIRKGILILRGHCPRLRILEIGELYNASVIIDESFNNFRELSISEGNKRSSVKLPTLLPNLEKITLSSSCKKIYMNQKIEMPALKTVVYSEIDDENFIIPDSLNNAKMLFFENILANSKLVVPDSFSEVEVISFGFIDGETRFEFPKIMSKLRKLCFKEVRVNMNFIFGDSDGDVSMEDQEEVVMKLPEELAKLESFIIGVVYSGVTVKLSGSLHFLEISNIENGSTIILEELSNAFTISVHDTGDDVTFELPEICNGCIRFVGTIGRNVILKRNNSDYTIPSKGADNDISFFISTPQLEN